MPIDESSLSSAIDKNSEYYNPTIAQLLAELPSAEVRATESPDASIDQTLAERGKRYGKFSGHAHITQLLKEDMRNCAKWPDLTPSQAEALDMIAHKIGRILNGDPNYADSWHDIAGYATLVENQLNGKDT